MSFGCDEATVRCWPSGNTYPATGLRVGRWFVFERIKDLTSGGGHAHPWFVYHEVSMVGLSLETVADALRFADAASLWLPDCDCCNNDHETPSLIGMMSPAQRAWTIRVRDTGRFLPPPELTGRTPRGEAAE